MEPPIIKHRYRMKYALFFSLIFSIAAHACPAETDVSALYFIQGNDTFTVHTDTTTIVLKKEAFAIRYFNKKYDYESKKLYAAQIAVLTEKSNADKLKAETKIDNIEVFATGSGLAASVSNRYDTIYIVDYGHHYLDYTSEVDHRVDSIAAYNDWLLLEWKIIGTDDLKQVLPIDKINYSALYFCVLIDRNLNGKIDPSELKIIQIQFKD